MLLLVELLLLQDTPGLEQNNQAPWPSRQDSSGGYRSSSSTTSGSSSPSASAPIRFTALHVTMIFIAILLCVVVCAIPWDNLKCFNSSSRSSSGDTDQAQSQATHEQDLEDGGAPRHPQQVQQQGLSKKMIKSLELVRYGVSSLREKAQEQAADGSMAGSCWTDCMICLGEFRNGQMIRVLPRCSHGFHKKCIDQWLLSHTSCPVCRDVVIAELAGPDKSNPNPAPDPVSHNLHLDRERGAAESRSARLESPVVEEDHLSTTTEQSSHSSSVYRTYVVVVSD